MSGILPAKKTDPEDPTYVELPKEHAWHKDGESCALLLKHMYGTREAGAGWPVEIAATLTNQLGCTKGDSACTSRHPERGIECSIHGDDLSAQSPNSRAGVVQAGTGEDVRAQRGCALLTRSKRRQGVTDVQQDSSMDR